MLVLEQIFSIFFIIPEALNSVATVLSSEPIVLSWVSGSDAKHQ